MLLLYIFSLFLLFIYSYTQVDLNLILSSSGVYQSIQNNLTWVGYFNRPLSSAIYIFILFCLFVFYFILVKEVKNGRLKGKKFLFILCISSFLTFFSYPAFSHDLFNYMFDARIVTKYHYNPYFYKALDFPDDSWIRFMRWTHRTYTYGPVWLLTTIPFSALGFGKFVVTLLNFKL